MNMRVLRLSPNPSFWEMLWVSFGNREKIAMLSQMKLFVTSLKMVWLFSLLKNLIQELIKKIAATMAIMILKTKTKVIGLES